MNEQRVIEALEGHGCSWRDYILLGEPPHVCICRWSAGLSALVIEDDALYREAIEFLTQQGARHFATHSEVEKAFAK